MFSWNASKQEQSAKTDKLLPQMLAPQDLSDYRDPIATMCLKKCINDFDEPDLNTGQRVCVRRCISKFTSSLEYMNRLTGFLELKVNNFQQAQQESTER